ncbi:MAG: glycosyltransferase family 2 protein [Deltaproteobacteria bacterium]|nr:glycosyltransferase family 2 protein [Deltaproteobacteria bacterium]
MRSDYLRVSAVLVCCDEEDNVERCLESLAWADEIIVVDSFSQDRTVELCRKYTNRIFQREWSGMVQQRAYAVSLARNKWVFAIDADEVVTETLRDEILKRLSEDKNKNSGYYIRRHSHYLGKWINHGGWYPDFKLRLFRKDKVHVGGENPHDKCFVHGKTARLKGEMIHYPYKDISRQLCTIDHYSDIVSERLFKKNSAFPLFKMYIKPPVKFLETYIYKLGFLDGLPGFLISVLSSYYVFMKYAKLWEKRRTIRHRSAQVIPQISSKAATSPEWIHARRVLSPPLEH